MMHLKKILTILPFLFLFCGTTLLKAQNKKSTDQADLPYQVEEIETVIEDAIKEPDKKNRYVRDWMDEKDFPQQASVEKRREWIIRHEEEVEDLLIARKKNFDKFH